MLTSTARRDGSRVPRDTRQLRGNDSFSWGDAVFLYLERPGMPLHVASVAVFEGEISLSDCVTFIASKLPLIPRYLQRVATPPLNIGLPFWEYDPEFDVRNHVREVRLRRGTEAELKAAAARILSVVLDRRRPLWDITLLRGLKEMRTGVVIRAHHCLADGIAGVGMMNVLMDAKPCAHGRRRKLRFHAPPPRDPAMSLLEALISSYSSTVQRVLAMHAEVLELAQKAITGGQKKSAGGLNGLLPEISAPPERLPFNAICRGPQKIAWGEIAMPEIKAVREVTGATVNDIVITVVTSALRQYLKLQGVHLKGRQLRIVVPVNMRGNGSASELGNRISFLPVAVPLDIRNPRKLISTVHRRMELLKSAHAAEFVGLAGALLGMIPPVLQALAGPVASQLPISLCNLICTNVPGPQAPLYLGGHKMLRWYPYVPIGGEMGINCAMLSYNGTAYFGFTGDVQAAPDLQRLEKFLTRSFRELKEAAGIKSPRSVRAPSKPAASAPKPREKALAMTA